MSEHPTRLDKAEQRLDAIELFIELLYEVEAKVIVPLESNGITFEKHVPLSQILRRPPGKDDD